MKTLFIDTHFKKINIILFNDYKYFKSKTVQTSVGSKSVLVPIINEIIANEIINEIIVINGPGSFTGIRSGITVAKTISYLKKIPIKSISYLDLMDYSLQSENNIVGLYDNSGIYIGKYQNHKLIGDYFYIKNGMLKDYDELSSVKTDVTIDFDNVFKYVNSLEYIDSKIVNPIYVKSLEYDKRSK